MARQQPRRFLDHSAAGAESQFTRSRAHEYHASDDSDNSGADDGGDLVFNWVSPDNNIDGTVQKKQKLDGHTQPAIDSELSLTALCERSRSKSQPLSPFAQPFVPGAGRQGLPPVMTTHGAINHMTAISDYRTSEPASSTRPGILATATATATAFKQPFNSPLLGNRGPILIAPSVGLTTSNAASMLSSDRDRQARGTRVAASPETAGGFRASTAAAALSVAVLGLSAPHPSSTASANTSATASGGILPGQVSPTDGSASMPSERKKRKRSKLPPNVRAPGVPLSALHHELLQFAAAAAPTQADVANVAEALQRIGDLARDIWPEARAVLFGSQATGLALPGADLDVVVLGASEELRRAGTGFSKSQRDALAGMLQELLDSLMVGGLLTGHARVIGAKVPIIKCHLKIGNGLAADISLGTANGARAVFYVCRQLQALPALRPLVLAVKAFLRQRGLNEVYSGGLSSYSIVNMLIGHLQREGHPAMHATASAHAAGAALPDERSLAASLTALLAQTSTAHSSMATDADLGSLLCAFFDLFGRNFSYGTQAVSVRLGGVVGKKKAWKQQHRSWLLAIEDPQEVGKDIGSGSFNMRATKATFANAAEALADVACGSSAARAGEAARGEGWEAAGWADVQAAGQSHSIAAGVSPVPYPQLSRIIDVKAAIGRDEESHRAREAQQSALVPHAGTKRKAPEAAGGGPPKRVKVKRKLMDRAQSQQQQQQRSGGMTGRGAKNFLASDGEGNILERPRKARAPKAERKKGGGKNAQKREARQFQAGNGESQKGRFASQGAKGKGKGKKKGNESGKKQKSSRRSGGWSAE